MTFRALLPALGLLTLLAPPGRAADDKKPARPNILFIFSDDHAAHAISAYGSKVNKTPNIDRLADEGMLFQNCFCTNSICAPSRAVILTGKHSHLNGVIDNVKSFDGSQQTFPKLLQKTGYQTAWVGKWHLKSDPTGFDRWAILPGQGTYYNPAFKTNTGNIKPEGYVSEITTDLALDWLKDGRDKDKPFFMVYSHKAPHREWAPGPKYLTMYDDVTIPEPPTLFDDWEGRTSAAKKQEMTVAEHLNQRDLKFVPPNNLTPKQLEQWKAAYDKPNEEFKKANLKGKNLVRWKYQRYMKDYLRCVASVDDGIGRVLKHLDDTGLAKNTVVIYSSDQGFYLGDNGWYDKRWMYDFSLRMPLLVRWPGATKPKSVNGALVQNLDFAQTFLEMAGVDAPADMQGRSLVPLLKGETPKDWRKSVYYHYWEFPAVHMVPRHYGVRTATHKLIHYYPIEGYPSDEWELFDLKKDPTERKSVYSDPAYAGVVKELKTELEKLREQYKVKDFKEPPVPGRPQPQPPEKPTTRKQPNVIFLLADDLGYGDLGCYGQKRIKTPNLDKMAAEGLRFTQFYAGSTVCAPSRCALMTGKHTGHCYIRGNSKDNLRPDDVTVAELLKKGEYTTGLVGKWGLGHEGSTGLPTKKGFDHFFGYLDQTHAHNYYPTFLVRGEKRVPLKNEVPNASPVGAGVATKKVEYSHDLIAADALDFVEKNKDRPFFLYLAFTTPHANNEAKNKGMEVPDLGAYKDTDWPEAQKAHAAMISRMDADIGKLLAKLKVLGIDDNTLVLFSSDNGPHREGGNDPTFNESSGPLRGIKRDLTEGGIRVPLLARWPGKVAAGKTSDHVGAFWDVLPTLAEIAGIADKVPAGLDGISFAPALLGQGEKQKQHEHLYWAFYERGGAQAVRFGKWKAIEQPVHSAIRLYDLDADVGEKTDLAEKHPTQVEKAKKLMADSYAPSPRWKFPEKKPETKPSQQQAAADEKPEKDRPNIVVFLADDLGWGDLGCYGHPRIKTPNLDDFAKQGMRFTQCYSAGSVCSPSRSSILTGRTPYRNGCFTWIPANSDVHLRKSEITSASLLKKAGYATCHVGKWHLNGKFNSPDQPQPGDHGYDWWMATQNNANPNHKNPINFVRNGKRVGPLEGYSAPLVVEEAVSWLKKERDSKKPFFLTVWTHEPHALIESAPEFQKLYPDLMEKDPDLAQHHGDVTQLDHAFGKLMKALDEMKLADNTVVVFTSDNGPEGDGKTKRNRGSTGGLRGRKRDLYEGGIRVPGIVRWPGKVKPGSQSDQTIIGSDLFPTACAIARVETPADRTLDGVSLLPAFQGKVIERKVPLYWRYHAAPGGARMALREGDWKIVATIDLKKVELFNIKDDPKEEKDLAEKEPQKLEALKKRLTELNAEIEKEGPDWWKDYKGT